MVAVGHHLSGMLVQKIERVSGELGTPAGPPLDQIRIVRAYDCMSVCPAKLIQSTHEELTGNLPNDVG